MACYQAAGRTLAIAGLFLNLCESKGNNYQLKKPVIVKQILLVKPWEMHGEQNIEYELMLRYKG